MTIAVDEIPERSSAPFPVWSLVWIAAVTVAAVLYLSPGLAPWAVDYPASAIVPIADWISAVMNWLKTNFSWFTRGLSDIFGVPLNWAINLLAKGWKWGFGPEAWVFPRLSWVGICAAFAIAGYGDNVLEAKFGGMLRALQMGAPPHGGIAPGIDRIVMLLAGEENLREVTMFPMTQSAQDLLMNAPSPANASPIATPASPPDRPAIR